MKNKYILFLLPLAFFTGCAGEINNGGQTESAMPPDTNIPAETVPANKTDGDILFYREIIASQIAYINALQLSNGAIPMYLHEGEGSNHSNKNKKVRIMPYFSVNACLGLLEDPDGYDIARRYMDWHFAHINLTPDVNGLTGTIYDYDINLFDLTETPGNDYDSTDSYAAVFLSLLKKYCQKTDGKDYLTERRDLIDLIADAILATENWGLTWAKPNYKVKYTMDNSEVYAGLKDAAWIYEYIFGDPERAGYFKEKSEMIKTETERYLWNEDGAYYYAGIQDKNTKLPVDLSRFYADAVCQLYPALFGVIDNGEERAAALYDRFNRTFPNWTDTDYNGQDVFPWAGLSAIAVKMGDYHRADQYLRTIKEKYIDNGCPPYWYCAEAGSALLAASYLLQAAGGGESLKLL